MHCFESTPPLYTLGSFYFAAGTHSSLCKQLTSSEHDVLTSRALVIGSPMLGSTRANATTESAQTADLSTQGGSQKSWEIRY